MMSSIIFQFSLLSKDYNVGVKAGPRFKRIREGLHLSQEMVGQRIGQARQVVSRFESEGNDPKISVLESFLAAVGSSLAEFFESRIPNDYADPMHAEIHRKLQEVLEAGGEPALAIRYLTGAAYDKMEQGVPREAKIVKPAVRTQAAPRPHLTSRGERA